LFEDVLLAAVVSAALFGGTLLWALRVERRRASLRARLNTMVVGASRATELPVLSLRRRAPQRKALPSIVAARLDSALASTGYQIGLLHVFVAGIVAAAAAGFLTAIADFRPVFAIALCTAASIGAPTLLLQATQSRYQRQFLDAFPDALDLIVRAVRAGLPAAEAMEAVTRESRPPVRAEFQRMLAEMRIGTEMEEALQHAADRIRIPDFRFFVVSLVLQRQTGGGIAETLSNLSTILRQRKALRQKARALTAEAQASAAVVAAAPFVAGGGLFLVNRELMSVLFVDPRGRFMLGVAAVCLVSGVIAMKALIKKNLP
jgi:tight adherence protein B